jgi:hypothetical protein
MELAVAVLLHPTNTEEAANALSGPRGKVGCIQCVDNSVDNLTGHKRNGESDSATALNVNPRTADVRGAQGWLERSEIAAKCRKFDCAGRVDYPQVREVLAGDEAGEKATKMKARLTSVSSYTSVDSSRMGTSRGAGGDGFAWERTLRRAACAKAVLLWVHILGR